MKNIHFENLGKTFTIQEINLQSSVQDNMKILDLKSSFAEATLKGQYAISTLVPTVQMFLYHYLPQYIKKPKDYQNQSFTFTAKINNVDSITTTLFPSIIGLSNSYIDANINSQEQKLSLDVTIPQIGYNNIILNQINIVSAGDYNMLDLSATGGEVVYNNETIIPSLQLISSMANDTASLALNTQSINELLGEASINCKATALNSNLFIHLLPSSIRIKDDHWQFYSNQDMVIGQDIYVNDFIVENGAQKITMNTNQTSTNNLVMDIENIDLESLSSYINNSNPTFYGRISGQISVDDFVNKPMVHANLFSAQILRINNDTLGALTAYLDYDVSNRILSIKDNTFLNLNNSTALITGQLNAKDSTVNLNTSFTNTGIAFLNQFLSDYIVNLNGSVTGNVRIVGSLNTPSITGSLRLENAKCKVLFLGTTYTIPKANLKFNNKKIEMENFLVKDEREGNYTGVVNGYISHTNFSDFFFNLHIDADNLLCLNTEGKR